MKKLIIILLFLSFEGYSQDFLGKAYYMSKSTVNMDWMKNMSPERQKYMLFLNYGIFTSLFY